MAPNYTYSTYVRVYNIYIVELSTVFLQKLDQFIHQKHFIHIVRT